MLGTIAADHTNALVRSGHSAAVALTGGFHLAFGIAAVVVAIGIAVALVVLRPGASPPPAVREIAAVDEDGEPIRARTATRVPAGGVDGGDGDAGDIDLAPQPA